MIQKKPQYKKQSPKKPLILSQRLLPKRKGHPVETLKVKLVLLEPLLGTAPKNKEIYKDFIASKVTAEQQNEELETIADAMAEVEKGTTGFHKDEEGIFIYDYLVKGFLKEAGNVMKLDMNLKNVKSKIDNLVFVFPRKLRFLTPDEKPLLDHQGYLERPLRAQTAQGPRVFLARSETVDAGNKIICEFKIVPNKEINSKVICNILEYGALKGLGQFRNGSYGRFSYEIIK